MVQRRMIVTDCLQRLMSRLDIIHIDYLIGSRSVHQQKIACYFQDDPRIWSTQWPLLGCWSKDVSVRLAPINSPAIDVLDTTANASVFIAIMFQALKIKLGRHEETPGNRARAVPDFPGDITVLVVQSVCLLTECRQMMLPQFHGLCVVTRMYHVRLEG